MATLCRAAAHLLCEQLEAQKSSNQLRLKEGGRPGGPRPCGEQNAEEDQP